MPENRTKAQSLSIYLVKEPIFAEEEIIAFQGLARIEIPLGDEIVGRLFIREPKTKAPAWAKFFEEKIQPGSFGTVSTASAVLLVEVDDRIFALTFGQGRSFLHPGCYEERFGLTVVLNSLDPKKIRSIDRRSLDSVGTHAREQASIAASIEQFDLDYDQDFLSSLTGAPEDPTLGTRLAGTDNLNASVAVELDGLPQLLSRYLEQSKKTTYKERFSWIDHIAEVRDKSRITELNDKLVAMIASREFDRIWMSIPEIVDWDRAAAFRFFKADSDIDHSDIRMEDFLAELGDDTSVTLQLLKTRKIYCTDSDGSSIKHWPAYRCLYAEIALGGSTYILTATKWFRVEQDFVNEVLTFYKQMPRYSQTLPSYQASDHEEKNYNKRAAETDSGRFACMDIDFVHIGGGRNKVEFCDLLSDRCEIIHVKKYGASSVLSHLFSQATVSADLFRSEPQFRRRLHEKLPAAFPTPEAAIEPSNFEIVLAIISNAPGDLEIPFFSKVNLRATAKKLSLDGFKVSVAKIDIVDDVNQDMPQLTMEKTNEPARPSNEVIHAPPKKQDESISVKSRR